VHRHCPVPYDPVEIAIRRPHRVVVAGEEAFSETKCRKGGGWAREVWEGRGWGDVLWELCEWGERRLDASCWVGAVPL